MIHPLFFARFDTWSPSIDTSWPVVTSSSRRTTHTLVTVAPLRFGVWYTTSTCAPPQSAPFFFLHNRVHNHFPHRDSTFGPISAKFLHFQSPSLPAATCSSCLQNTSFFTLFVPDFSSHYFDLLKHTCLPSFSTTLTGYTRNTVRNTSPQHTSKRAVDPTSCSALVAPESLDSLSVLLAADAGSTNLRCSAVCAASLLLYTLWGLSGDCSGGAEGLEAKWDSLLHSLAHPTEDRDRDPSAGGHSEVQPTVR